jgi:hypothetical protein
VLSSFRPKHSVGRSLLPLSRKRIQAIFCVVWQASKSATQPQQRYDKACKATIHAVVQSE